MIFILLSSRYDSVSSRSAMWASMSSDPMIRIWLIRIQFGWSPFGSFFMSVAKVENQLDLKMRSMSSSVDLIVSVCCWSNMGFVYPIPCTVVLMGCCSFVTW